MIETTEVNIHFVVPNTFAPKLPSPGLAADTEAIAFKPLARWLKKQLDAKHVRIFNGTHLGKSVLRILVTFYFPPEMAPLLIMEQVLPNMVRRFYTVGRTYEPRELTRPDFIDALERLAKGQLYGQLLQMIRPVYERDPYGADDPRQIEEVAEYGFNYARAELECYIANRSFSRPNLETEIEFLFHLDTTAKFYILEPNEND